MVCNSTDNVTAINRARHPSCRSSNDFLPRLRLVPNTVLISEGAIDLIYEISSLLATVRSNFEKCCIFCERVGLVMFQALSLSLLDA